MAKRNDAITVTFNDNDGSVGWSYHPAVRSDLERHHVIFGLWRTRWILFKAFWRAMILFELMSPTPKRRWIFFAEIPE